MNEVNAETYKVKAELKELLKETLEASNIDISVLASKVMCHIYKHDNLKRFFENKVNLYNEIKIKNVTQFNIEEEERYNKFASIIIDHVNGVMLSEFFALYKNLEKALDCEYSIIIKYMDNLIPQNMLQDINESCIYNGIFYYYQKLYLALYDIPVKGPKNFFSQFFRKNSIEHNQIIEELIPLYDFYYLKEKECNCNNLLTSNNILLKIAIIKVLDELIDFIVCNPVEKDLNKMGKLTKAQTDLLEEIMKRKLYNDVTITTQDQLTDRLYHGNADYKNESKKQTKIVNVLSYILPDYLKNTKRAPIKKLFYIASVFDKAHESDT